MNWICCRSLPAEKPEATFDPGSGLSGRCFHKSEWHPPLARFLVPLAPIYKFPAPCLFKPSIHSGVNSRVRAPSHKGWNLEHARPLPIESRAGDVSGLIDRPNSDPLDLAYADKFVLRFQRTRVSPRDFVTRLSLMRLHR